MNRLSLAALLVGFSATASAQESRPFPLELLSIDAQANRARLRQDLDQVRELTAFRALRLTEVVLHDGRLVDLNLTRIHLAPERFGILVDGEPRPDLIPGLDLSLWKGTVSGEPDSSVMLSFANTGTSGWIRRAGELVHFLPRPDDRGSWHDGEVLVTTEAALGATGMQLQHECATLDPTGDAALLPASGAGLETNAPAGGCSQRECMISVETDYQLYQVFNDLNALTSYVTTLLGFVSDRYETQADTVLTFPYLQFYTDSNDPWSSQDSGGGCGDVLDEFRAAWQGNIPAGGRIGHFLSGADLGCGVAYVDVLCDNSFNFSVSGNINGNAQFPIVQQPNNWDFMVIAHELGHNFGASHTHSYCPPLDECPASQYWGPCQDEQICLTDGTIMSYCHLCPGGTANITTFFHPTISTIITGRAQDCLPPSGGDISGDSPALIAPSVPTTVTAQVSGTPVGSVELWYRYQGGAFAAVAMTDQGGGVYAGDLPAPGCDDVPEYYFGFTDAGCGPVTDPAGAPGSFYSADVGALMTVFADDFESDLGWTAQNLGASTGDWQRGVPVDDDGWAYDPASDYDGSGQCFVTQNEVGNTDVDGGSVRLFSPTLDMTTGDPFLTYAYYARLTDDDGTDRILVEISSNGSAGPWTEIARHDMNGGSDWHPHSIASDDLASAGVTLTTDMVLRFTANDDDPQSIFEAGIDAFEVSNLTCDDTPDSIGTPYCGPAAVNSTGLSGELRGTGSRAVSDNDVTLTGRQLPTGETAMLLVSPGRGGAAMAGGGRIGLCVGAPFAASLATLGTVDGSGQVGFPVDLTSVPTWTGPVAAQPGERWYFQVSYRDGGQRLFTDGLRIRFQ